METKELVKATTVDVLDQNRLHNDRVREALGIGNDFDRRFIQKQVKDLQEDGFQCFVTRDIESKFPHRAGINGAYSIDKTSVPKVVIASLLTCVFWAVPILLAVYFSDWDYLWLFFLSIGLAGFVWVELSPWYSVDVNYVGDIPEFVLDNIEKAKSNNVKNFMVYSCNPLPVNEVLVKVDPVMVGWLEDGQTGVVIGIWDRDQEISI